MAPGGGWLYHGLESGLGEVPEGAAVFGIQHHPKNHLFFPWKKGVKPISRDSWRSFGCFPGQQCLQERIEVQVKLENKKNGFKKLCRRKVGREQFANPPELVSPPPPQKTTTP